MREGGKEHRGTLRYAGPVGQPSSATEPTSASPSLPTPPPPLYLGIDWDDPSRGKHDGSNAGTRYFHARHPTSATFLKAPSPPNDASFEVSLGKGRSLSFGVSFISAVRSKYAAGAGETGAADPGAWGGKVVELVGWEKLEARLKKIETLAEISVSGMDVRAGEDVEVGELGAILPSVVDLDVSRGLWPSLTEIGRVVGNLPSVENVRMGGNLLAELDPFEFGPPRPSLSVGETSPFRNIRTLALTHLVVSPTWALLLSVLSAFPNLVSLALSHNDLSASPLPEDSSANPPTTFTLSELSLEACHLSSLPTFLASRFFPRLNKLNLSHNVITTIDPCFSSLSSLNLTSCHLSSWTAIHALNSLQLSELRLRGNPILSSLALDDVLPILTARLAHPSRINGTEVTSRDRSDAELWYASRAWNDPLRTTNHAKWVEDNPRFQDLVELHSLPYSSSSSAPVAQKKQGISSHMLTLLIRVHRNGKTMEVKKKVPPTLTVNGLGRMVAAKRLVLESGEEAEGGREVGYYLEEGGVVDAYL